MAKDESLVSDKDRERYRKMQQTLAEGKSPFAKFSEITRTGQSELLKLNDNTRESMKAGITEQQVTSNGKWREVTITYGEQFKKDHTIRCIAGCGSEIDFSSCVYVRLLVSFTKRQFSSLRTVETSAKSVTNRFPGNTVYEHTGEIKLPVYATGNVCRSCFNKFYAMRYDHPLLKDETKPKDENGYYPPLVCRVAEAIEPPKNTRKETFRKNHRSITKTVVDSPVERTNSQVKGDSALSTKTVEETGEVDEEGYQVRWKVGTEPEEFEPVDPKAYRAVTSSGSKHPAYCGCSSCKRKEIR